MNVKVSKVMVFAFLSMVATSSFACTEAELPALPDPQTAALAEMIKAQKSVKKYLAESNKFLNCTKNNRRHDVVVDQMHKLGEDFNKVTKLYKARS